MRRFTSLIAAVALTAIAAPAAAEKLSVYHWFEYIPRSC